MTETIDPEGPVPENDLERISEAVSAAPAPPLGASLHHRAEEALRGLWASLFYSEEAAEAPARCTLVCSADRQEGASTIACGLAMVGSEPRAAERVALVDFNLRNPAIHRLLRLPQSPGIGEIIAGGAEPASVANRVNDSLDVFTAGEVEGRILEMLRSNRVREFLLDGLSRQYGYVIIDAAAVNQYPDAQALARTIKRAVLVARTGDTPREAVAQARKSLESTGASLLGVVLNARTYPIPRSLYRRI